MPQDLGARNLGHDLDISVRRTAHTIANSSDCGRIFDIALELGQRHPASGSRFRKFLHTFLNDLIPHSDALGHPRWTVSILCNACANSCDTHMSDVRANHFLPANLSSSPSRSAGRVSALRNSRIGQCVTRVDLTHLKVLLGRHGSPQACQVFGKSGDIL